MDGMANVTQLFDTFQTRLSSLMTRTLNDQSDGPATAVGNISSPSSPAVFVEQAVVPVVPSELADCLVVQQQANERLQSIIQSSTFPRHTLAEMSRYQRLKRFYDVQTNTLKVEHEMHRLWSTESVDAPQTVVARRRAITILQKETIALRKQSEELTALITGSGPSKSSTSSATSSIPSSPGRRLEWAIYHIQVSIERLLQAVLDFGSTINAIISGGGVRKSATAAAGDDQGVLREFDAIGTRTSRSSTSSVNTVSPPRATDASAAASGFDSLSLQINFAEVINRLLSALPINYDPAVLKAVETAAAAVAAEKGYLATSG